jgi:transcriptional regulator PpsR
VKKFITPKTSLGDLDADTASMLIAAATDLALIVDSEGIIRDLAFNSDEVAQAFDSHANWVGRPWIDTVTIESRPKILALLSDAISVGDPKWRQLNHPVAGSPDVPVLYSAVPIGDKGSVIAFGRDLRAISVLQQRLIDAQQSMERDYLRLRHVETRYRLLFQMSTEAVLILDGATLKINEANPAARALFGDGAKKIMSRAFPDAFEPEGAQAVQALLAGVRAAGRADDVQVRLAESKREVVVSASLFRQEEVSLFLVRLSPMQADAASAALLKTKSKLLSVVESAPDAFVVTEPNGRVITANAAFLEMAQLASEEQARGESLERWLGRPGADFSVLTANLRQRGSIRLFATSVRGEYGASVEVEISAVAVVSGGQPCLGFTMRNVGRRLSAETRTPRELPRSVEQLTELVGRVSLKDLVRETTDLIERLCIEAALELAGDNRASAAEMLGLSRQSLYVKLRRYGLGDLEAESENQEP